MANTEKGPIRADLANSHGKSKFTAYGREKLDTGGGSQVITVAGAAVGDIVIASLEDDDSGTSITTLTAKITAADTLTIVRTDDGSSSDDAYCSYIIIRPNE